MPPYCRCGKILPDSIFPIFTGKILVIRIPAHFLRFPMLSSVYRYSAYYPLHQSSVANRWLQIVGCESLVANRWLQNVVS